MELPANPDALAKKFFVITLLGVLTYVTAVITLLSTAPEHSGNQGEEPSVTVAQAAR
jgi:hypothetical protein